MWTPTLKCKKSSMGYKLVSVCERPKILVCCCGCTNARVTRHPMLQILTFTYSFSALADFVSCLPFYCFIGISGFPQKDASWSNRPCVTTVAVFAKSSLHCCEFQFSFCSISIYCKQCLALYLLECSIISLAVSFRFSLLPCPCWLHHTYFWLIKTTRLAVFWTKMYTPEHPCNLLITFLLGCFCLQLEACAHSFFDELRDPNTRLPNGRHLPQLFNFKQEVFLLDKIKLDSLFLWLPFISLNL